jgi:hypothetical protein
VLRIQKAKTNDRCVDQKREKAKKTAPPNPQVCTRQFEVEPSKFIILVPKSPQSVTPKTSKPCGPRFSGKLFGDLVLEGPLIYLYEEGSLSDVNRLLLEASAGVVVLGAVVERGTRLRGSRNTHGLWGQV